MPETIFAEIFDASTGDRERLTLVEQPTGGTFRTTQAIQLVSTGSPQGDGKLDVRNGGTITASYVDSAANEPPITAFAQVTGTTRNILASGEKFDIEIAPNPYRVASSGPIKLQAQVSSGSLMLRQTEIFNIAGEKIKTIPDGQLQFGASSSINANQGAVVAMDWWNIQGDDGQPVASGTYFAKFHVTLTDGGGVNQVTTIKKLLILQQ